MERQVSHTTSPSNLVPKVARPIPDPARSHARPVPSRSLAWAWVWEFSVRCLLLALGDSSPCIEAFSPHSHTSCCYWTRTGPGGNLDAAACLRDNLRNVHIKRMQGEPLATQVSQTGLYGIWSWSLSQSNGGSRGRMWMRGSARDCREQTTSFVNAREV